MSAPSTQPAASAIVFVAIMGLADALLVAWWRGSMWGMVSATSAIIGLIAYAAWVVWRSLGVPADALRRAPHHRRTGQR